MYIMCEFIHIHSEVVRMPVSAEVILKELYV